LFVPLCLIYRKIEGDKISKSMTQLVGIRARKKSKKFEVS